MARQQHHAPRNHTSKDDETDYSTGDQEKPAKAGKGFWGFVESRAGQAILIIILILTAMFLAAYFRSYTATLPITEQWAQSGIEQNIKSQIASSVNQQYPNLPQDRRQAIIDEQYAQVLKEQGDAIATEVATQAILMRQEFQKADNKTYLLELDPYYWWLYADNYLDHGYSGDEIVDGQQKNMHMIAPLGVAVEDQGHTILIVWTYKVASLFDSDADLMNVMFWMPVWLAALSVIPAFFIAKKKGGVLGGFMAAALVAVHPVFLGRTPAGFSDTDVYNVLFPLLIFWVTLEALEAKRIWTRVAFAGGASLFIALYAKTWPAWWYIFDFLLLALVATIIWHLAKALAQGERFLSALQHNHIKDTGIVLGTVAVFTSIFVILMSSWNGLKTAIIAPLNFHAFLNAAQADLWPNVRTTVAELNPASIGSIIGQAGGKIMVYLAFIGILLIIMPKKLSTKEWITLGGGAVIYLVLISTFMMNASIYLFLFVLMLPIIAAFFITLKDRNVKSTDIAYALLVLVWFVGTIYASTKGVRFILLLVPAFSIAFGVCIGNIHKRIAAWAREEFPNGHRWMSVPLAFAALLLLITPISQAHQTALSELPLMNDTWWESLVKIREGTDEDAIITSWWDYGHHFKAIADRPVTFDGTSQSLSANHWVGRMLSTDDDDEAVGILRMLDCGNRQGFERLAMEMEGITDYAQVKPETVLAAKKAMDAALVLREYDDAVTLYQEEAGIGKAAAERVADLTHCEPPEAILITSSDMIGKAGVWGHFGAWNFNRAYIYLVLSKETPDKAIPVIQDILDLDKKAAGQVYYEAVGLAGEQEANAWISPWPSYITSNGPASCREADGNVTCTINANIGSQGGQLIRIEQSVTPLDDPTKTVIVIAAYDQATGQRLVANEGAPSAVIIGDGSTMERFPVVNGSSFDLELFVAKTGNRYQAVLASPELATGLFTRLYFLDGAYTEHFEKFSDMTSPVTGERIVVWKVSWAGAGR